VPAANLHATLCFIGAVEPEKLQALRSAAAGVRGEPFTLHFRTLEFWDGPRIICATVGEDATDGAGQALASALAAAALAVDLSPDIKPFRPHLTLVRKVAREAAGKFSWPRALAAPFAIRCERFALVESHREASGSIYSELDSWPLYADESR
jgi:2'-5' RNA ligase